MSTATTVIFLLSIAILAKGQLKTEPELELNKEVSDPQPKPKGAVADLKFEMDLMSDVDRPPKLPTLTQAKSVYDSQKDRVLWEAKEAGENVDGMANVTFNPVLEYFKPEYWRSKCCCPKRVNYQCTRDSYRLPCFPHYVGKTRMWCCSARPVYVTRCTCNQCIVMTEYCATQGRCQLGYNRTSFMAVCSWGKEQMKLFRIVKEVPSKCYCISNDGSIPMKG